MEFDMVRARCEDAGEVADVIRKVFQKMEHREWYVADNEEYVREKLLDHTGMVWKAVEKESGELAGVFMMTFPGYGEENLGWDLGFDREQCLKTTHMESAAVLPAYRGNHLQQRLMEIAEAEAKKRGYRYLLCTIHPDNLYSKKNALRQGYQVMATKEKYGGLLRDILMKRLDEGEYEEIR